MTYTGVQAVVGNTTEAALGVLVTPHMFRTSGATTAAVRAPRTPGLASALLQHVDPRVTEQHYNRATAHDAAKAYAALVEAIEDGA
jgi:integrase